jgi:hypothetical protein
VLLNRACGSVASPTTRAFIAVLLFIKSRSRRVA